MLEVRLYGLSIPLLATASLFVVNVQWLGSRQVKSRASIFNTPSEIVNHFGGKSGSQRVHHSQNVDNFLSDGATYRT